MIWYPMDKKPEHDRVIIAVFDRENSLDTDILRVTCGERGAYFRDGMLLSIHEEGWVPFAWTVDNMPNRNDAAFPPLWADYLTNEEVAAR
jgi:hypothetical protein